MLMEPIPYFYEAIDRNAIIVRPLQPFYDWVNDVFRDDDPVTGKDENNIYLVREMDSNEEVLQWVKKNFDMIFVNELNDWNTDEEKWPVKRTFRMFQEWFSVEVCSMVLDLEEYGITKE